MEVNKNPISTINPRTSITLSWILVPIKVKTVSLTWLNPLTRSRMRNSHPLRIKTKLLQKMNWPKMTLMRDPDVMIKNTNPSLLWNSILWNREITYSNNLDNIVDTSLQQLITMLSKRKSFQWNQWSWVPSSVKMIYPTIVPSLELCRCSQWSIELVSSKYQIRSNKMGIT